GELRGTFPALLIYAIVALRAVAFNIAGRGSLSRRGRGGPARLTRFARTFYNARQAVVSLTAAAEQLPGPGRSAEREALPCRSIWNSSASSSTKSTTSRS